MADAPAELRHDGEHAPPCPQAAAIEDDDEVIAGRLAAFIDSKTQLWP
jgi:hypothetical protein